MQAVKKVQSAADQLLAAEEDTSLAQRPPQRVGVLQNI
jgi:hypothetical protein